ncbi:hypothetical protein ACJIZ3_013295 [Penstemon smallii]|uniref:Phosphate transporter n=1 Tax=Penstemon smallii TaxID=265156 RepID=A0ABD3USR0_9LAMI
MSDENGSKTNSVELAFGIVGKWKQTYQWIPFFAGVVAIAMAFLAGANNIPISFSSLIGSGRLTFLKVALVSCVLYVPGAVFGNNNTVNHLLSNFIRENQPSEGFLMWSMVVVLITATIWLALATYFALPVSPQQSIQAALLGTILVTKGFKFLPFWNKNGNHNFSGGGLLWIFLEWTIGPMISCACAFCFFVALRKLVLRNENGEKRVFIFLPTYYGIAAGLLCLFIMYQVIPVPMRVYKWTIVIAIVMTTLIGALLSLLLVVPLARTRIDSTLPSETTTTQQNSNERKIQEFDAKDDDGDNFDDAVRDFMQMRVLNTVYEEDERSWGSPQISPEIVKILSPQSTMGQSTAFKQLLESTPNQLVQTRNPKRVEKTKNISQFIRDFANFMFFPVTKCDRETLIRHALAEKFDEMEDLLCFPHILTSCIFALIQSVSETAALLSPFQVVFEIFNFRADYSGNGETVGALSVNWWFRATGGLVASIGFLLCGWRLTQCLATRLTYISHSRGLAFQLSAVATMILMNRANFPASSIHISVGALLGVGIADESKNVNWKVLLTFMFGWVMTIIFCCLVAYGIYFSSIHSPAFVVP